MIDLAQPHDAHCKLWDFVRAAAIAPYGDEENVRAVTRELTRLGFPVLESHKLAATDCEHVKILLDHFDPPKGAAVLDAGCGTGAVATLMAEQRSDLRFSLLNWSAAQLEFAPATMPKIHGDFHDMPIDDGTFDAVMFNFVLGHALLDKCLSEASRVLRPGGLCFAYDLTTDAQSIDYVISRLGYKPHPSDEVVSTARRRGLESGIVIDGPPASIADFVTLFGAAEFYRVGLDRTRPIIYRFTKAVHCPVADDERHGVVAREARLDKTIAS